MHPHSFRHYFAKQFMKKSNNITLLGDLLGHSDLATTAIYTRQTAEEQKKGVDKIIDW
jgi:site-specific recombinase XerC